MPDLRLAGCTTQPLANYLKALGALRLVSLQADPQARGRWRNGVFELRSKLNEDRLAEFFLNQYKPTPILSPWNGGCGFYPKKNPAAVANLGRIEESDDDRLSRYRDLIASTRRILADEGLSEKPDAQSKERLVRRLRGIWPDDAIEWLDSAVVLTDDKLGFPPILGSGGNDGRYDFSSNMMNALGEVLLGDTNRSTELLRGALHEAPVKLDEIGLAHLRRDASPTNSPWGEAPFLGNPWDLILSVEGAISLAAGAVRKLATTGSSRPTAPFTVWSTGAGYGSAAAGEPGRAELWLPLWKGWSSFAEITMLAREFRAQVGGGRRLRDAVSGLDLARAAGERGVALGLTALERYALLERAGQSTLAVPIGRVEVNPRPGPKALREIDRWLRNAIWFAEGEHAPNGAKEAIDHLQRRAYTMASIGDPASTCATLEALGETEAILATSRGAHESLSPLHNASAAPWIEAGDDGSHEFALAVAIASLRDYGHTGQEVLPTIRDYLHGTRRGAAGVPEFDSERRHAVTDGNPFGLLAELHARRHLDVVRAGRDAGSLGWDGGAPAELASLHMLAANGLDVRRLLALVSGLCTLRHAPGHSLPRRIGQTPAPEPMLDLTLLAWHKPKKPGKEGEAVDPRLKQGGRNATSLGARPGWAARLAKGGAREVTADAILRLRLANLTPVLSPDDLLVGNREGPDLERSRRLSAALLPRLRDNTISQLFKAQVLTAQDNNETKDEP